MSEPRRLLCAAMALALAGCGGARATIASQSSDDVTPERVGQRALLVLERPMDGLVAVTVWIDAGALDGASAALVTAELVAASTHDLDATVLPDGTRFRRMCEAESLATCVLEIGGAVALRSFSEEALADALRAVSSRRERGSSSSRREAEALAASGALGIELAPLGDAETTASRADVSAFLEDHYGAERSLWIAVGDVHRERFEELLRGVPSTAARASRHARHVEDAASSVRAVEHPDAGHWAIATRVATSDEATALANAWAARRSLARGVEVSAFPTRAGWLAMVSFPRREDQDVARWAHVEPEPLARASAGETAWDIADRLGARWIAGEPRAEERTGIALVGRDAEAATRAMTLERPASPWDEAARIPIGDAADLSIVWALPGPAEDGASAFGATRIASEILAHRCAAEGRVWADGDGVVIVRSDSPLRARALASRWRDCVALSEPTIGEIEAARRVLVARATLEDERLAAAARAIAPHAPGLVAPEASRQALSDVPADDVLARWRSWRDAGRWGLAGAVDERGAPPPTTSIARVEGAEVHVRAAVAQPELVIIEAIPGCGEGAHGAALERAWASLARALGLEITWSAAGASRQLAWGAVAVRGDAGAVHAFESSDLDDDARATATREAEHHAREARAALASPVELARRGALGPAGGRCDARPIRGRAWLEPHPAGARR